MATVKLLLRSKKNPANLYVRFCNGRAINIERPTGLFVNPAHWNKDRQQIRNVIDVPNRDELNSKLAKLSIFIIDSFNESYSLGEIVDGNWLKNVIAKFFNRPKEESAGKKILDHKIYLSSFADYWIKEKAPSWKVSAGKYMSSKTKAHYKILNDIFKRFEGQKETISVVDGKKISVWKGGNKIRMKDITTDVLDRFSEFLSSEGYANITSTRMIGRLKFFCERAVAENCEVNMNFKSRVFVAEEKESYKKAYLNEAEITKMFKHDFSYNESLDNARDNFVIACLSGLRVSDFLRRLDVSNFSNGYIEIKTAKTGTNVVIPVHKYVEAILEKRNGQLPAKISDQKFNVYIKNICQVLEFDEMMLGGVVELDTVTKKPRKKIGMYAKYKLISSHSGRRSFATNNFGKIPNSDLCAICGWKSESQMLAYIQKSNKQSAEVLKRQWESNI